MVFQHLNSGLEKYEKKKKPSHTHTHPHTDSQVAICLGVLTSLPVWRSAEGKVPHPQHLSLLLYTLGSYLCLSPFTFHAHSFSFINAHKWNPGFPPMNLTCVCESSFTFSLYQSVSVPPWPSIPRWPCLPIPTIAPARAPINPTSFVLPLPSTLAGIYDSTLNANGV